ncbi:aldehyde reductase [Henriciella barbarensis]|uniref:Aldehyde reductase n=1 Tax=Henriciella barbarensis TaxID=86342 RepID=A0A399QZA6_9PROT|nr:aldehyde reductase [Henriciella barbarensis]RIJ24220.1 aldehyde reductase [Henriciella barbarensis]
MAKVLVTGATGFIASHLILQLIERGYEVRGTARSTDKAARLNQILSDYAGKPVAIEIVAADLNKDEGWAEAVKGVDFVQHVASPFPTDAPKSADELIIPARDGALRVLRAAKAEGVKRVVMTSSMAAIGYGWGEKRPETLTEVHWSNADNLKDNTAYARSKTIAEKAAWDYVNGEGAGLELSVINPVAVLGPAMSADVSSSLQLVSQPLEGKLPAFPKLSFGVIDVRDVARAHIEAMERPEAVGERFICGGDVLWMDEMGEVLRKAFPDQKIPKGTLPNWLVRLFAQINPPLKQVLPELGKKRAYSNKKLKTVLGIDPIPADEAIIASAKSLIELDAV